MIDDIKPQTKTIEFKGETYEVPPITYGERQDVQRQAEGESEEAVQEAVVKHVLSNIEGIGFDPDEDSIDDVSIGFLQKVQNAMEKGNGLEDFTDDRQHPTVERPNQ